jgi:hypothetical protein
LVKAKYKDAGTIDMATIEKMMRDNSTIGLMVATIFIISLQVTALIPLIAYPLEQFSNPNQVLLPTNITYIVAYFLAPLVYYVGVSLLLNPKRIVSPFYAQIGTIGILTMMLTYRVATTISATDQLLQNLVNTIVVLTLLFGEAGYFQLQFVRWIVGLNYDSVDRASFLVEGMSFDSVKDALGKSFIDLYGFGKPNQEGNVWILSKYGVRSKWSLILVIGQQPGIPDNSIIATAAFQRGICAIVKTKQASSSRNEIVNNIKGKLGSINPKIQLIPIPDDQLDDDASILAHSKAKEITISKLGIVAETARAISLFYKVLIALTLFAIVGLILTQVLTSGNYLELIIALLVALGVEIGIPLHSDIREQLLKRKTS